MQESHLTGEKKGRIYNIILNRPNKRNAITFEMLANICEMSENVASDPDVKTIIIKGEGKIFSAGVDLLSLASEAGSVFGEGGIGGQKVRAFVFKYQQYLNRLEAVELPIICAMHGKVLGLGVELALACDIRLMSDNCVWSMPELKFGFIADLGGTTRLSRTIGPSRAMEVLITAKEFTAQQALKWGLVNHIYPEKELIRECEKLVADINECAPLAVGITKKIIKQGASVDLATQLDMAANLQSFLYYTEDVQEGIKAAMEKRKAIWKKK